MIWIFLVLAVLVGLVAWYLWFLLRRILGFWGLPREKRWAKLLIWGLTLLFTGLSIQMRSMSMLLILHTLVIFGVTDLLRLLLRRLPHHPVFGKLHRCGLIPIAISLPVLLWGYFHMTDLHLTTYTLDTDTAAEGTRILFVSDLHFGNALEIEDLPELQTQLQATAPDLILLGGDLVDESTTKAEMQAAFAALGSLESTYGTYYVPGNHDLGYGMGEFSPEDLAAAVAANGITLLQDEAVPVGNLTLLMRRDISLGARATTASLTEGSRDFLLVVDHQPANPEENAAAGADLMLSGHTHNGQIFPLAIINRLLGPVYGRYQYDQMELIVSSGVSGWGFPVRTSGISEYVIVDLV